MKKILASLLLVLMAVTVSAAERSLSLKGTVSALRVSAGVDVTYIPDTLRARVLITGPAKNINNVKVTLRKGVLHIYGESDTKQGLLSLFGIGGGHPLKDVKVTLYAPHVARMSTSSGAELEVPAPVNVPGQAAEITASSGSDISIEWLTCGSLQCNTSSGADIDIDILTTRTAAFDASSGSDIDIDAVTADSLTADATSGGDISIAGAANTATVKASSGGSINVRKLSCPAITTDKSTGGTIKK